MNPEELAKEIAARCAVFAHWAGSWDADMEIRPGPGVEPLKMKAVSVRRLIAGGRWLITEHKADSGFEGHGILGWDASAKRYSAVWVDNMQAAIAKGLGDWDGEKRSLAVEMEVMHQGQAMGYRETTTTLEEGRQVYTSTVSLPEGKSFEMLKITYTLRK